MTYNYRECIACLLHVYLRLPWYRYCSQAVGQSSSSQSVQQSSSPSVHRSIHQIHPSIHPSTTCSGHIAILNNDSKCAMRYGNLEGEYCDHLSSRRFFSVPENPPSSVRKINKLPWVPRSLVTRGRREGKEKERKKRKERNKGCLLQRS